MSLRDLLRAGVICSFLLAVAAAVCAQQRTVTVVGSVSEEVSGQPVPRVSVLYGGAVVATTDNDGRFRLAEIPFLGNTVSIAFQRIGYERRFETVDIAPGVVQIELHVTLVRFPTILEEITVDGRQITIRNPGLIGFYRRREEDFGWYLTQEEIDRSIGFTLDNFYPRLRMPPPGCTPLVPFVVFLDGVRVPPLPPENTALDRVNQIVMPGQVGGVEVYTDERAERLPPEFTPAGPYCGVALFWTRHPKGPSAGRVFAHVSSGFGRPTASRVAFGGGIAFPLRSESVFEFQGGIQFVLNGAEDLWRAFIDATARPLGSGSPWVVGLGMTVSKPRGGINSVQSQTLTAKPSVLSGLRLPGAGLQPFVEVRLVDVFRPGEAFVISLAGLGIQFGG